MKKLKMCLYACLMLCLLSGCYKQKMVVDVKEDGSVVTSLDVLASKDLLKTASTDESKFISDLKKSFASNDDVKVEEVKQTIDGSEYVGLHVENADSSSVSVTKDEKKKTLSVQIPFDQFSDTLSAYKINKETLSQYGLTQSQLKNAGVEMTIVVNMPDTPTTNIGSVEGNTVTIDLFEEVMKDEANSLKTITITCPLPSSSANMPLIIGIILVAALAIGGFVYYRKKKQTSV